MTKNWLEALQDAIHDTDPDLAELKIRIAEMAISSRFDELEACPDPLEKQALLDALGSIRLVVPAEREVTHKRYPPGPRMARLRAHSEPRLAVRPAAVTLSWLRHNAVQTRASPTFRIRWVMRP